MNPLSKIRKLRERRRQVTDSTYVLVHRFVKLKRGKASRCENVQCPGLSKTFEWALKRGCKYDFNEKNFLMLCSSCHRKYDYTDNTREKLRKFMTGKKLSKEIKIKMSKAHQGELAYNVAMTKKDVKEVRKSLADGVVGRVIAKKYGVREMIISNIKTRRTWKHI